MTGEEQKKDEAPKVSVKVIKEGWTHRGQAMKVGEQAEVTERQAKMLRDKGLAE